MTERERLGLERVLEQLDDTRATVAELARSAALAATPLAQAQAGLEQATREVWRALQQRESAGGV